VNTRHRRELLLDSDAVTAIGASVSHLSAVLNATSPLILPKNTTRACVPAVRDSTDLLLIRVNVMAAVGDPSTTWAQ
jgi:hypothetical protein